MVENIQHDFSNIAGISKDRVQRIARHWLNHGCARPERRGGAREKPELLLIKNAIRNHISSFTCRASHYARRGEKGRKYLPSDMSVSKMHKMFKVQNNLQVTYSMYYSVFRYDFNLGFGHPATDVCSSCVQFKFRLKNPEKCDEEKKVDAAMYILHRRRARMFYDLLNNVEDSVTVCFDVMENQVLPKSPIGQSYYSRQLYMYVFGVVNHHGSQENQCKEDISLFVWMEHQNNKDSNMTASALWHYFTSRQMRERLGRASELRLFSDSCYGQNKNVNLLSMLFSLRKQKHPSLKIKYNFPVRGHSYLPADRVFGRIGREIKSVETILLPKDYMNILRNHGNVYVYGVDWECFNYKKESKTFIKTTRSFKISEAKTLLVDGDKLGFASTYNGELCYHVLLKRGKSWANFQPEIASRVNRVKKAKKTDILKLLDHIGVSDEVRSFYVTALQDVGTADGASGGDETSDSD